MLTIGKSQAIFLKVIAVLQAYPRDAIPQSVSSWNSSLGIGTMKGILPALRMPACIRTSESYVNGVRSRASM
jgi:hypothetical protein